MKWILQLSQVAPVAFSVCPIFSIYIEARTFCGQIAEKHFELKKLNISNHSY